jgi:lysozyme
MKTSHEGRKALHEREGCCLTAYKDSVGVWTIGYGHTSSAGAPHVHQGLKITQAEAEEIFARDLKEFEDAVDAALTIEPLQHQFDAYVSFAYNVGGSGMAKSHSVALFNQGDVDGAAKALMNWSKPPEIIPRRRGECVQLRNDVVHARIASKAEFDRYMAQPVAT